MEGSSQQIRPHKRIMVVVENESAGQQRIVKNPKTADAESVPTEEVVVLRQQLLKAEGNFQRAVLRCGELQARVEFLENLIDTKPVVNGSSKTEELEKKVIDVTSQLDAERRISNNLRKELRKRDNVDPEEDNERIDKLATPEMNFLAILQSCSTDNSVSIDDAFNKLRPLFEETRQDFKLLNVKCEVCGTNLNSLILAHFFSKQHYKAVRFSGARISPEAVQHWFIVLSHAEWLRQSAAAADPTRPATVNFIEDQTTLSQLVVRRVPLQVFPVEVESFFSVNNGFKSLHMPMNADGSHRGFGFVDFTTKEVACRIFERLSNGMFIHGQKIILERGKCNGQTVERERRLLAISRRQSAAAAASTPSGVGGAL